MDARARYSDASPAPRPRDHQCDLLPVLTRLSQRRKSSDAPVPDPDTSRADLEPRSATCPHSQRPQPARNRDRWRSVGLLITCLRAI
jgi:hypothetical protein